MEDWGERVWWQNSFAHPCCGLLSRTKSAAVMWDVNSFYIVGIWGQYFRLSVKKKAFADVVWEPGDLVS